MPCREAKGKGAGIATFLHRAAAYHPGLSRASSLQDPTHIPAGPQNEVMSAQTALRNAIALCKRHVRDSVPEVKPMHSFYPSMPSLLCWLSLRAVCGDGG